MSEEQAGDPAADPTPDAAANAPAPANANAPANADVPAPPAPSPRARDAVTEGGYSYTLVDEPRPAKQRKVKREPRTWRISAPVVAALIVVPAVVVGVAAWAFADRLGSDGDSISGDRTNANVASLMEAFTQAQTGRTERFEGAVPASMPDDVPVYPGARVVSSMVQLDGEDALYLVVYDTGDAIDDVTRHFDGVLAEDPWQIEFGQEAVDATARQFSKIDDIDVGGQFIIVESTGKDVTTIFLILQVVAGAADAELADFEPPISKPLPEGFPADLPHYPGGVVTETVFSRAPDGDTFGLTIITRDSPEGALEFFRDDLEAKGWSVSDGDPQGSGIEDAIAVTFESADGAVGGSIAAGTFFEDRNYTQIALQVRESRQDDE